MAVLETGVRLFLGNCGTTTIPCVFSEVGAGIELLLDVITEGLFAVLICLACSKKKAPPDWFVAFLIFFMVPPLFSLFCRAAFS